MKSSLSEAVNNGGSRDIYSTRNTVMNGINEYSEDVWSDQSADIFTIDAYLKPSEERIKKRPSSTSFDYLRLESHNTDRTCSPIEEKNQFQVSTALSATNLLSNRIYSSTGNFDTKSSSDKDVIV